jgi:UDP-N-acetylmuramoyl-tripeptide--D-alanyl-D-alanine ligase
MRFRLDDIARAVDGSRHGDDVEVDGVAIDSRVLRGGELFVPIVADRDGHDFLGAAARAGAAAVLTHAAVDPSLGVAQVAVADTSAALLDIGRLARSRLGVLVVGITGSVGKTSVKDLTAAALAGRYRTAASERSFNNELGVPLTLANAPDDTEAAVIEMGARGRHHIELLCDVAHPTIGVVTAVAAVHTELFGSVDEVAVAKGELVESLPAAGTAVLNQDDDRVRAMATRTAARVMRYSAAGETSADVVASGITLDRELHPSFRLTTFSDALDVRLGCRGEHQVGNALAATAAALACGVPLATIADGLSRAELSPWRMDLRIAPSGALVLNDAYNANPSSVAAALRSLAALPTDRHVAVLGVMAELGEGTEEAHARIADLAADLGIDLVPFETDLYGPEPVHGVDDAVAALGRLDGGDAVLVKGSRVAGLERVAAALLEGGAPA